MSKAILPTNIDNMISYLAVKHVIILDLIHVLLVFCLTLKKIGLVLVSLLTKTQSEIFMELRRLSNSKCRGGECASNTSGESNEHQLERSHGSFPIPIAKIKQ
jgi:hypothetical protein